MRLFLKAKAASSIATGSDYLVTIVLKEWLQLWYLAAVGIGMIVGGVVNFSLGRSQWVFQASQKSVSEQAVKYLIVWAGNFVLVWIGVYGLSEWAGLNYMISKTIVSLIVSVTYNYVLQKDFVFG